MERCQPVERAAMDAWDLVIPITNQFRDVSVCLLQLCVCRHPRAVMDILSASLMKDKFSAGATVCFIILSSFK